MTILFADLVGSTTIGERLEAETFRAIQTRYFATVSDVIERHGGTVEKYIGDAVMAVFGLPTLHEDDALRAVRAAGDLEPSLAILNADLEGRHGVHLELRIGVHTGEVIAGDTRTHQAMVSGDTVNTAARLEAAAGPGEILLGPVTNELVRDAVAVEALDAMTLRGRDEELSAFRLLAIIGDEAHVRRLDTPLVGRGDELAALRGAFDRAVSGPGCELVTIVAAAGTGKSRLVREFLTEAEIDATIVRGRCLNYGDGITYWAFGEILRAIAGIDDTDDPEAVRAKLGTLVTSDTQASRIAGIVASVLGVSPESASAEDISWAARRTFGIVAARRPLIVLLEDIHWAEPALLDMVESIIDWSRGAPILLLCPARPELFEARLDWAADRSNASVLLLEPLDARDASALVDVLPGGLALPAPLRVRVLAAAEGNPLFVEEFLAMLVDGGYLTREVSGTWAAAPDLDDVRVPRSISMLIAARLDRLDAGDRGVAQRGSVIGRVFERGAVSELSPEIERSVLVGRLESLTQRQVIRPDALGIDGDVSYRFRHVLIRDAAYAALTKSERADLHERVARWLERVAGDRLAQFAQIHAFHLAEAVGYWTELGTVDQHPELVVDAVSALLSAADRSSQVHAYLEEVRFLRRVLALAPLLQIGQQSVDQLGLLERAAEAARLGSDPLAAVELGDAALVEAARGRDPVTHARLHVNAAAYAYDVGDDGASWSHIAEAQRLLALAGSSSARADVLARIARRLMIAGRLTESEGICRDVIAADGVDDVTLASAHITLATDLWWLERPEEMEVEFAAGRARAEAAGSGGELSRWFNNYAFVVERRLGREAAMAFMQEGISTLRRLGMEHSVWVVNLTMNIIAGETELGHASSAEAQARRVLDGGISGRDAVWAATILAHALMHQARYDEAHDAVKFARRLALKWAGSADLHDLADVEAQLNAWTGALDRAAALAAESRAAAPSSQASWILKADATGLRAYADLVERARSTGDHESAIAALAKAKLLFRKCLRTMRDRTEDTVYGRHGEAMEVVIRAEYARARGVADPSAWARAARLQRDIWWLASAAYADWRRAQALVASGADGLDVSEAVLEGIARAKASEPARLALISLADAQGIELEGPTLA